MKPIISGKVNRVLLVNDDGIDAPGFLILKKIAQDISNEIWILAPKSDKSGSGRSITLRKDIKVVKRDEKIFEVDGTPTDCVILGLNHFMRGKSPDLVLSGVNAGRNAADDVTYSGTVGAAWESAVLGTPSLSLSQMYNKELGIDFSSAKMFGTSIVKKLLLTGWPEAAVININFPPIPSNEVKGIKVAELDSHKLSDNIINGNNISSFRIGSMITKEHQKEGSDLYELKNGFITITPLNLNVTNYKSLKLMRENLE